MSDEGLRTVIVHCGTEMRAHILWHVDGWPIGDKLNFLTQVWPLQLAARSPVVSSRLCGIAFDDETNFPALVTAILPLLSPIEGSDSLISFLHRDGGIFKRHSEHVLTLLCAVLPDSNSKGPYGFEVVLERLAKADPGIVKHPRYVDLKRRYARRL